MFCSWAFHWKGLTLRSTRTAATRQPVSWGVSPLFPQPHSPCFCQALSPQTSLIRRGMGAVAGFGCFRCFWALRPAIQAQAAIVLVVSLAPPRRLRGSMAFHRPRPSLRSGALFHRPGLTRRSSGLAYGHPLSLHVSPLFSSAAQPMLLPSSVTPSKPHSLGRGRCGGLRLFQVFWAAATR